MNSKATSAAKAKKLHDVVKPIPTTCPSILPVQPLACALLDIAEAAKAEIEANRFSVEAVAKSSAFVGSMLTAYGLNVADVGKYSAVVIHAVFNELGIIYSHPVKDRVNSHLSIHSIIRRNLAE